MFHQPQRPGGWWQQGERWTQYMLMVGLWKRASKPRYPEYEGGFS